MTRVIYDAKAITRQRGEKILPYSPNGVKFQEFMKKWVTVTKSSCTGVVLGGNWKQDINFPLRAHLWRRLQDGRDVIFYRSERSFVWFTPL